MLGNEGRLGKSALMSIPEASRVRCTEASVGQAYGSARDPDPRKPLTKSRAHGSADHHQPNVKLSDRAIQASHVISIRGLRVV